MHHDNLGSWIYFKILEIKRGPWQGVFIAGSMNIDRFYHKGNISSYFQPPVLNLAVSSTFSSSISRFPLLLLSLSASEGMGNPSYELNFQQK
jgi:hypothetical protein